VYGRTYLETVFRRYTEMRATNWTHFYGSGIRLKRTLWHLFPQAVRSSILIRVRELNPFNSELDHMRSPRARKWKARL